MLLDSGFTDPQLPGDLLVLPTQSNEAQDDLVSFGQGAASRPPEGGTHTPTRREGGQTYSFCQVRFMANTGLNTYSVAITFDDIVPAYGTPIPFRTTGLSRRRWLRLLGAATASAFASGCGGTLPRATAAATPLAGLLYESRTFGYRVTLPPGWRRATHPQLSYERTDVVGTGRDVFTVRSEDEDKRLLEPIVGHAGAYLVLAFTALVTIHENPQRLPVAEWVALGRGLRPPPAVNWRVSGRPAVRIDLSLGAGQSIGSRLQSVYVARDDVVFEVGPNEGLSMRPEWLPPGWAEQKLEEDIQHIVDSLELTR